MTRWQALLLFLPLACAAAGESIEWSQRLGAQLPLGEVFTDEGGARRPLGEWLGGKPTILTFAYFHCPNLCPLLRDGLAAALQGVASGQDYRVLTVGIDPTETPAQARAAGNAARLRLRAGAAGAVPDWTFLTGTEAAIARLTRAAGFHAEYDPASRQYAHPSGLLVASADGVIRQYLLGIRFDPRQLERAVERAGRFRSGSLAARILLFCSHYDPSSSLTGARVWLGLRLLSALCLCALAATLGRAWIAEWRR